MPDERKRKVIEMLPILELLDLPGMRKAVSLSQSRSTPARLRVNLIHNHKISGIVVMMGVRVFHGVHSTQASTTLGVVKNSRRYHF